VTDHVVISDRVLLDVAFAAARARLEVLARDAALLHASELAYGEGMTSMADTAGSRAGMSRLAGMHAESLAGTQDCARIALRWEATAADGTLFAALDADLTLTPAGNQITVLALSGAYRPPPGTAAAGLDQASAQRCAAAAIRSFLARAACTLVHPAGAAGPEVVTPRRNRKTRSGNRGQQ
jgi:hypothetical protein